MNGPRYDNAARVACEWLNLHDPGECKAKQLSRLIFLILDAMNKAEEELAEMRHIVSRN